MTSIGARVYLYTDGGARGNPGPAACGVRIISDLMTPRERLFGESIGVATNNVAEYKALLLGLKKIIIILGIEECRRVDLILYSDSELMVRQLHGVYKVRDMNLLKLYEEARESLRSFNSVVFKAILRGGNRVADRIVNEVLDYGKFSSS